MKQRIRPLLLLKKRSAAFQRVGQSTFALQNRLMDDTLFGELRVVGGWTGSMNCSEALTLAGPFFDGATNNLESNNAGGFADSRYLVLSFWYKSPTIGERFSGSVLATSNTSNSGRPATFVGEDLYGEFTAGGFYFGLNSVSGNEYTSVYSGDTMPVADSNYHHFLMTVDSMAPTEAAVVCYVDNTPFTVTTDGPYYVGAEPINFSEQYWQLGFDGGTGTPVDPIHIAKGCVDFYYISQENIDITDPAVRARFYNPDTNGPADPGGTSALVYCKGTLPGFLVNEGSGADYTNITGTVVDCT